MIDAGDDEPEAITRATYERIAPEYALHADSKRFRGWIAQALEDFEPRLPRGAVVLILGSGAGKDAGFFLDRRHRCILVDYAPSMLMLARRVVPRAELVLADLRALPFADASADAVWASACLYHLRKASLPAVLDRIFAILRPGGHFYFNLRVGAGEGLDPAPRSFRSGGARFYALYGEVEIETLAKRFEQVATTGTDASVARDYVQLTLRRPLSGASAESCECDG